MENPPSLISGPRGPAPFLYFLPAKPSLLPLIPKVVANSSTTLGHPLPAGPPPPLLGHYHQAAGPLASLPSRAAQPWSRTDASSLYLSLSARPVPLSLWLTKPVPPASFLAAVHGTTAKLAASHATRSLSLSNLFPTVRSVIKGQE